MSLPQILKAEEASSAPSGKKLPHKAVIMIYLSGGPSHQDMYDLKMDAPVEIRGSFKPIQTNVPGIEICEHMPRLAQMMDKFAIIRSLYGSPDQHASDTCLSGFPIGAKGRQDNRPSLGSAVSRLHGAVDRAVPPFVGLTTKTGHAPYSIHYQEVFATLYQQLGIDVRTATIPDNSGRPQYLLDHQSVVKELV